MLRFGLLRYLERWPKRIAELRLHSFCGRRQLPQEPRPRRPELNELTELNEPLSRSVYPHDLAQGGEGGGQVS